MENQNLWPGVFNFPIWTILKMVALFVLGIYFLFALVVLRQVGMMTETITNKYNWLVRLFAWLHLFLSVGAFIFALVTL